MNLFDWYKKVVFENYANFSGRATRSEYWYFTLLHILIIIVLAIPAILDMTTNPNFDFEPGVLFYISIGLIVLYMLLTFIPRLSVTVRRLHDSGKSGWYYLLAFTPYIGNIIILILMCLDTDIYTNKWGPNPFAPSDEINQIGESRL